ncbi:MAG: MazG family protein [Caldilineaceae bacterium]|nr:MazG family protein [Caldilineaceae bacterium]
MTAPQTAISLPELSLPEADIVIVGLGPGDVGNMPLAVWQILHTTDQVILRTERHPGVDVLRRSVAFETCDDLYESHADFADVYAAIVQRVLDRAQRGRVVYAVPGHPWIGEMTTPRIITAAVAAGLSVDVLGGASFVEPSWAAVGVDPMDGSQIVDGMLLAQRHHPQIDVNLPALIAQVYARHVASDVKLVLLNAYPPEHPVTLIHAAGTSGARTETVPLHEMDHRDDFDHLTSVYVPSISRSSLVDLQELIAHLRAPEGCPWDQEQTLSSLKGFLLDETAETVEAIDNEDDDHTVEELGDLLGIVAMIAQVGSEEGRFQMADAIRTTVEKLTRRHPHVFGEANFENMDNLYVQWDEIKAQERKAKGQAPKGPLDLPASLPALEKARQMQSKAEKAGLLNRQELAQENPALAALLPAGTTEEDLGRVLWQLVAVAKRLDLEPESALRSFAVRFREDTRT